MTLPFEVFSYVMAKCLLYNRGWREHELMVKNEEENLVFLRLKMTR